VEVWLFLGLSAQTRTSAVLHDLVRLLAGVSLLLLPEVAYLGTYFLTYGHAPAVIAGGAAAAVELLAVVAFLRRS
jgi:hypothetical protein